MPRKKVSKAAHIRAALEQMGQDAAPKDVIAALAAKKIKVSAAQVSNVKASLRSGPKKGKRGRVAKSGNISIGDLVAAKKLASEIGLERAQEALSTLAKLTD